MPSPAPLDALRLPLEFALRPGAVTRVRGLHQTLENAARRVSSEIPQPLQARLLDVVGTLKGFDALPEVDQLAAVQRAHGALLALAASMGGSKLPASPPLLTATPQPPRTPLPPAVPAPVRAPRATKAKAAAAPPAAETPALKDPLAQPVSTLRGVGPKLAVTLADKGISTLADLLRTTPRAYEDRTTVRSIDSLNVGERALVRGVVKLAGPSGFGSHRRWEVHVFDGTGTVRLTYFRFNAAQMQKRLPVGTVVTAAGAVGRFGAHTQMVHPEVTLDSGDGALSGVVPVYPDLDGIPRGRLRSLVEQALERVAGRIPEILPQTVRDTLELPSIEDALRLIHQPPEDANLEALTFRNTPAHKRLAFEEFFIMQVALGQRRRGEARHSALPVGRGLDPVALVTSLFPFPPTGAQSRVVGEIAKDLCRNEPMARLLQGDVGSGKTAVAAAACLMAVRAGCQAAVVAPTEILAEQHFKNLTRMLARLDVVTDLITGSRTNKERASALARLRQGVTQVVVGTHAVLQEDVAFKRLGLAVIDEQHRFGVEQRAALRERGPNVDGVHQVPHLLVMTATPIPRTLALTLYGDLDISVLNEMPPGRKPVKTTVVGVNGRPKAVEAVRAALLQGRQAYVVYPLVEESDKSDLEDATRGAEEWRSMLPGVTVELLHGRMSGQEKDRVMTRFSRGEVAALVSTTVIEVGVDVPNASVMVIEHAERFGLSQLHQLRGRVGRGAAAAECWLVARAKGSEEAERRLDIMAQTQDGFRVAEEDLAIRGPGDFFGTRQAGAPPFMYANLLRHGVLLEDARTAANAVLEADPELQAPHHAPLKNALEERYLQRINLANAG